jgi:hypothetical protein
MASMKGNGARGNGAPAADSPVAAAEELAGFLMAHAVWCVSEGSTLVPLIGYVKGGERIIARFGDEQLKDAVEQARAWMERNPEGADRAVFIHDAYVTLEGRRMDALVANVREYAQPPMGLQIVLPYRPASAGAFAVHRPKFQAFAGIADFAALGEAFFRGVNQHEHGARIWNESIDQSL